MVRPSLPDSSHEPSHAPLRRVQRATSGQRSAQTLRDAPAQRGAPRQRPRALPSFAPRAPRARTVKKPVGRRPVGPSDEQGDASPREAPQPRGPFRFQATRNAPSYLYAPSTLGASMNTPSTRQRGRSCSYQQDRPEAMHPGDRGLMRSNESHMKVFRRLRRGRPPLVAIEGRCPDDEPLPPPSPPSSGGRFSPKTPELKHRPQQAHYTAPKEHPRRRLQP